MSNIPKLRFKEFSKEWKEDRLKNVVKVSQGLQIAISDRFITYTKNRVFYITIPFIQGKKVEYIENPRKSILCNDEDILVVRTGSGVGKIIKGVNGAFHNNFFKIKDFPKLDNNFIYYFLIRPKTQFLMSKYAGTSAIPDLNHSDFYAIFLDFPSVPEQKKIATFLISVDTKIDQLNQKLKLLQSYKKGVMQKIFSQEIRFKADDGSDFEAWEEKRLSEMGSTYNGLTNKDKNDFKSKQGYPYLQYKQIFDKASIDISNVGYVCITLDEVKRQRQNKVKYGDILFTTSSETPLEVGMSSVLLSPMKRLYLNSFCFGYRPNSLELLHPMFAKYLFRNRNFRKEIEKLAQGSTRYNISKKEVMKIKVDLPNIMEQIKIANFLSSIDTKIEQTQEQLKATKAFKKSLLQQMFI